MWNLFDYVIDIFMSFNCIQEHHDLLLSTLPAVESALEVCLLIYFFGGWEVWIPCILFMFFFTDIYFFFSF